VPSGVDPESFYPEEIKKELAESLEYLSEQGFSVKTLALPGGAHNELVLKEAQQLYAYVRGSERGFNPFPLTFPLKCQVLTNKTTYEEVISWVEETKRDKKWLILQFHQIDSSQRPYATSPDLLSKIIGYVSSAGLPLTLVSEVEGRLLILPQPQNGSFEDAKSYERRLTKDFKKSKEFLNAKLRVDSDYAAYPYGIWNKSVVSALKKAGFKGAFTGKTGINSLKENQFLLKRILVEEGTSLNEVFSELQK